MRRIGMQLAVLMLAGVATARAQDATARMVSGRIFDDITTCPLRGARLNVSGSTVTTVSDAQGRYYLRGAPSSAFSLSVMLRGYESQSMDNVLAPDADTRVDFSLVRAPADSGKKVIYPAKTCVLDRRDSTEVRRTR